MRIILLALPLLCLAAAAISALSNRALFAEPTSQDRLTPLEEATFQEIFHLREQLGHAVWASWDQATIPILMFNEKYAFLAGHPDPPAGWLEGGIAGSSFNYYTKEISRMETAPQNFAQLIGDQWAGTLAVKSTAQGYLVDGLKEALPSFVEPIFPFRLVIGFMLPTEQIIAATLHESFHAYQAQIAPLRFEEAELAYFVDDDYWKADVEMHDQWQMEIDLLVEALQAVSVTETESLARRFLDQRQARRESAALSPELIDFERRLEWLEGLAMYVEFGSWRAAASTPDYRPLPVMDADPDFTAYAGFDQHWERQLQEMGRQAVERDDIRFYFSGMAQSMLLDRLAPGWKEAVWADSVWLESLLDQVAR